MIYYDKEQGERIELEGKKILKELTKHMGIGQNILREMSEDWEPKSKEKPIVYVDMDGVIADFHKTLGVLAPHIDLSDTPDNKHSYDERSKMLDEFCINTPNVFRQIAPIEDGIEAVKYLSEFFEIGFLSTPMDAVHDSYSDKRIWLQQHFGDFAKKRLILTHRKDRVIGDYLIDDRTRNGAGEFKGEHIHYGTDKFPTWASVVEYLMSKI